MKSWDYRMQASSVQAAIFSEFEIQLYKNIYADELGSTLFDNYIFIKNVPVRNTLKLLKANSSSFFDNITTADKVETRDDIIRASFVEALNELAKKFDNNDYHTWTWGSLHKITMNHPLGIVPALRSVLNIGPYEIGGNGTTVANAEYNFSNALMKTEFNSYLGASMRMIIDLSNTKSYNSILAAGQSGQPLQQNYRDQARLWLNGDYKKVDNDIEEVKKNDPKILILKPE
jgi:penicillin amidase